MNCEEYVVERAKTLESDLAKVVAENKFLQNKLNSFEEIFAQMKPMFEFKDDSEYRKITLSVYEKYDKEEFDALNSIFQFVDDTDVEINIDEE